MIIWKIEMNEEEEVYLRLSSSMIFMNTFKIPYG